LKYVKKAVEQGVGGVMLKSTFQAASDIPGIETPYLRPYMLSLRKFGLSGEDWFGSELRGYTQNWIKGEGKQVRKLLRDSNIPFAGSVTVASVEKSVKEAKFLVEEFDVDFLEAGASCPMSAWTDYYESYPDKGPFKPRQYGPLTKVNDAAVIEAVVKEVNLPVVPKIGCARDYMVIPEKSVAFQKAGASGIAAMNYIGEALVIDADTESLWGWPTPAGYHLGRAMKPMSLFVTAEIALSSNLPVSSIGGIWNWRDAVEFLLAGAANFQVVSGVYNQGWKTISRIREGLAKWMDQKGYSRIEEFRGKILKQLVPFHEYVEQARERPAWVVPTPIYPVIEQEKCTLCGICETHCVYEAITVSKELNTWKHNRKECQGCGMCISICPEDCLTLQDDKGRMVWSGKGTAKIWWQM
jgi:ferredoxin